MSFIFSVLNSIDPTIERPPLPEIKRVTTLVKKDSSGPSKTSSTNTFKPVQSDGSKSKPGNDQNPNPTESGKSTPTDSSRLASSKEVKSRPTNKDSNPVSKDVSKLATKPNLKRKSEDELTSADEKKAKIDATEKVKARSILKPVSKHTSKSDFKRKSGDDFSSANESKSDAVVTQNVKSMKSNLKRKAEEDLASTDEKKSKPAMTKDAKLMSDSKQVSKSDLKRKANDELSSADEKKSKPAAAPNSKPASASSGSRNPSAATGTAKSETSAKTPQRKSTVISQRKNPPPKNSFAEVMSREAKKITGIPVHKDRDPISDKQLIKAAKRRALEEKLEKKYKLTPHPDGTNRQLPKNPSMNRSTIMKARRRSSSSSDKPMYQGTARKPSEPCYRGTMRPSKTNVTAARKQKYDSDDDVRVSKPKSGRRFSGSSDENSYGYSSRDNQQELSDYSDMDAGFDEVEEEDRRAELEAKKEDAREQRLLDEAKRKKEEKKKREALATALETYSKGS